MRRAVLGAGGGARGRRRLGRRRSALFTADGAYAYSQSHRRRLIQRQDRAVNTQDVRADDDWKREPLYHQQRMTHRDACDFNRHVNIPAYLSAGASNADDFRSGARERLYRGRVGKPRVYRGAQHRQRLACVDERVRNTLSAEHSFWVQHLSALAR